MKKMRKIQKKSKNKEYTFKIDNYIFNNWPKN